MFRAILAALANAMKRAWDCAVQLVFWPFWLFARPRAGVSSGVDIEAVKDAAAKVSATRKLVADVVPSLLRDHQRDAQIAWSWAATSLLARATQPFPKALSKNMQSWLRGLDHEQLSALKKAGKQGIFEHCSGKKPVANVPLMQPLAPVVVRYPARTQEAAHEISEFGFRPA